MNKLVETIIKNSVNKLSTMDEQEQEQSVNSSVAVEMAPSSLHERHIEIKEETPDEAIMNTLNTYMHYIPQNNDNHLANFKVLHTMACASGIYTNQETLKFNFVENIMLLKRDINVNNDEPTSSSNVRLWLNILSYVNLGLTLFFIANLICFHTESDLFLPWLVFFMLNVAEYIGLHQYFNLENLTYFTYLPNYNMSGLVKISNILITIFGVLYYGLFVYDIVNLTKLNNMTEYNTQYHFTDILHISLYIVERIGWFMWYTHKICLMTMVYILFHVHRKQYTKLIEKCQSSTITPIQIKREYDMFDNMIEQSSQDFQNVLILCLSSSAITILLQMILFLFNLDGLSMTKIIVAYLEINFILLNIGLFNACHERLKRFIRKNYSLPEVDKKALIEHFNNNPIYFHIYGITPMNSFVIQINITLATLGLGALTGLIRSKILSNPNISGFASLFNIRNNTITSE